MEPLAIFRTKRASKFANLHSDRCNIIHVLASTCSKYHSRPSTPIMNIHIYCECDKERSENKYQGNMFKGKGFVFHAWNLRFRSRSNQQQTFQTIKPSLHHDYSVFLFSRRVIYKLSSEVGCGEVTNPKQPMRERDRQSPTALQCYYMCIGLRWGQCYFIATQQFAERSELGTFLARMSN